MKKIFTCLISFMAVGVLNASSGMIRYYLGESTPEENFSTSKKTLENNTRLQSIENKDHCSRTARIKFSDNRYGQDGLGMAYFTRARFDSFSAVRVPLAFPTITQKGAFVSLKDSSIDKNAVSRTLDELNSKLDLKAELITSRDLNHPNRIEYQHYSVDDGDLVDKSLEDEGLLLQPKLFVDKIEQYSSILRKGRSGQCNNKNIHQDYYLSYKKEVHIAPWFYSSIGNYEKLNKFITYMQTNHKDAAILPEAHISPENFLSSETPISPDLDYSKKGAEDINLGGLVKSILEKNKNMKQLTLGEIKDLSYIFTRSKEIVENMKTGPYILVLCKIFKENGRKYMPKMIDGQEFAIYEMPKSDYDALASDCVPCAIYDTDNKFTICDGSNILDKIEVSRF